MCNLSAPSPFHFRNEGKHRITHPCSASCVKTMVRHETKSVWTFRVAILLFLIIKIYSFQGDRTDVPANKNTVQHSQPGLDHHLLVLVEVFISVFVSVDVSVCSSRKLIISTKQYNIFKIAKSQAMSDLILGQNHRCTCCCTHFVLWTVQRFL